MLALIFNYPRLWLGRALLRAELEAIHMDTIELQVRLAMANLAAGQLEVERDQTVSQLRSKDRELTDTLTHKNGIIESLEERIEDLEIDLADADRRLRARDHIIQGHRPA